MKELRKYAPEDGSKAGTIKRPPPAGPFGTSGFRMDRRMRGAARVKLAARLSAAGLAAKGLALARQMARLLAGAAGRRPAPALTAVWASLLMAAALAIPLIVVNQGPWPGTGFGGGVADAERGTGEAGRTAAPEIEVPVYIAAEKTVLRMPLETYVRGVVSAEMPLDFELEALKAQALAARTYIVQRYMAGVFDGVPEGVEAWVTDTARHQVFLTEEKLAELLGGGPEAEAKLARLNRAVEETAGRIIVYGGEPIVAAFFSTSNGYTENSEDYWQTALPYLRSVESPWEEGLSPKFRTTVTMPVAEVKRRLGLGGRAEVAAAKNNDIGTNDSAHLEMSVLEYTEGRRIKTISAGGRIFTGREVREKLGLASSAFTWRIRSGEIEFTAYGSGHGVGMSQWGAQGMALEGRTAEEIVAHYYTGVKVEDFRDRPGAGGAPAGLIEGESPEL